MEKGGGGHSFLSYQFINVGVVNESPHTQIIQEPLIVGGD